MIQRFAQERVREYLESFPVTGVIGPRQVGKTTLARQIEREWRERGREVVFLDMELPADEVKLKEPYLFLEPLRESLVIIDEVQRVPELFPVFRALIDRWRVDGRFLLLGSAAPTLLTSSSESLAGRIGYCELPPLLLGEIIAQETEELREYEARREHLLRGGFPPSFLASSAKKSMLWRREFLRSYIERDLPLLGLPADPKLTRNLLTMLAHYHGQIWNMQPIAASLGISTPTLARYVGFLEHSFLVSMLPPYFANTKKRLVKSPKIYIRDSGVLASLLGIHSWEQLSGHPQLGAFWEGYAIEQIRGALSDGQELMFYRTQDGAESDLVVCEYGQPLFAIEIKYTSAPKMTKGLQNVIADLATKENFIVIPQGTRYYAAETVQVLSLTEMLALLQRRANEAHT